LKEPERALPGRARTLRAGIPIPQRPHHAGS
jgi:hypothetical protein